MPKTPPPAPPAPPAVRQAARRLASIASPPRGKSPAPAKKANRK